MDPALAWAILGLVLVITELVTGTFCLLVLAVAAFGAAAAAWFGLGFPVQCIVAAAVSAAGCYGVHLYRVKSSAQKMPPIDAGMPASFENWLDQPARRARVHYRGASWDAVVEGEMEVNAAPGTTLYVIATHGNTLKVSTRRPA